MSPINRQQTASSNIYTAIIGLTLLVAVATCAFVAYKCSADYGTIFKIVEAAR